jgi:hypothetical protein
MSSATGDAIGLAVIDLPRLHRAGQPQVADGEADQAGLGLGAAPGGALVADLAARAGGGAGERRDRGRVVVGLDLEQHVDRLGVGAVDAIGVGEEALRRRCRRRPRRCRGRPTARRGAGRGGGLDQLEQRAVLGDAVDHEARVEDLVPAVLAVGLREHHQLDVGGIAAERAVGRDQVVDLVGRQRQAERAIGRGQRGVRIGAERDVAQRPRRAGGEQRRGVERVEHALGHAIGERGVERGAIDGAAHGPRRGPLDARHRGQPGGVRDVGGLARPRRDRAEPRRDVAPRGVGRRGVGRRALEQRVEDRVLGGGEWPRGRDDVDVLGGDDQGAGARRGDRRAPPGQPRRRQRRAARDQERGHAAPSTAAIRARASPATGSKRVPVTCSKLAM